MDRTGTGILLHSVVDRGINLEFLRKSERERRGVSVVAVPGVGLSMGDVSAGKTMGVSALEEGSSAIDAGRELPRNGRSFDGGSDQPGDGEPVIDVVRSVGVVFPDGGLGDAERLIDGGGEVFRGLRGGDGIGADGIGGPDDAAT